MKIYQKISYIIISILLLTPFIAFNQNNEVTDLRDKRLITAAKEIMIAGGTCALITLDEEGRPRVRAMDAFLPEDDLTVWFGTTSKSRKVTQIKNDPRVTLYYLDSDASGYVMIHGIAELVNDPKEKENRWKDEWEAFYTDKTKDYLLIKVSPIWMEISSTTRAIFSDTISWQPPMVRFNSEK
jgi:general stress protein 26